MRSDGWGNTYHHRRPPALAAFGDFSGDPHSDCGGFPCRGNCPMRRLEEWAERFCCHASRSTATESTWCSAAKRNGARSRAAAESVRTRGKTLIELPERAVKRVAPVSSCPGRGHKLQTCLNLRRIARGSRAANMC